MKETDSGILFADVCGSVQLYERLGNDRALERISTSLAFLSVVIHEHGGDVIKTIGDELMCAFPDAHSTARAGVRMLDRLRDWPPNQADPIGFRVGMDYGKTIHRDADVFGDTVNIAARMVSLANENQLITTDNMVAQLPDDLRRSCRLIGPIYLKGKAEAVAVHELVWEESDDATVIGQTKCRTWRERHQLRLTLGDKDWVVGTENPRVTIGRSLDNDLVDTNPLASRNHLVVEMSGGKFAITDRSTNGTYIRSTLDGSSQRLHRDQLILVGSGWFSLGQSQPEPRHKIEYRIE